MLDKSIGEADRRQYTAVRDPHAWKNPFLLINGNGTITMITGGTTEETIGAAGLEAFLLALAPAQWPFGRVVSIRPCSVRSEVKEQFDEEDRQLKATWGQMRQTLRALKIEMNMLPSGESTHAVVRRAPDAGNSGAQLPLRQEMEKYMREAIREAQLGLEQGGIPIGSVLVRDGKIIARGHNRRIQQGDPTAHAEIDCLHQAGRQKSYRDTVLYSTLMPCAMCAGAAIQFKIPLVVAGDDRTYPSSRRWMELQGVRVVDLNLDECYQMMQQFAKTNPEIWHEDIGEIS